MNETTNTVAAETVAEVKLTREQKLRAKYDTVAARITKDTESLNDLVVEINNISALAAITVGSAVTVKLGRKFSEEKDTTRYVAGVVVGVKEEDDSKLYKVSYGSGFDADIVIVGGAALSLPVAEPAAAE